MKLLAALSFLTVIPLSRWRKISPEETAGSIAYFPVAGVIIGFILAGLNWLLGFFLPSAVVMALLIVSLVIISGGLHLDGLADTCDGLAGSKTAEERWQVMDDSRSGAFGVAGVFLLLLLKYVSLSNVPANWLMPTLLLMPAVSRWAMVLAIFSYPYAKPAGTGKLFKEGASWPRFALATIVTLAVAIGWAKLSGMSYYYFAGLAIIVIIWIMVLALAAYLKGKFGGLTGDNYGAINEVMEAGVLILVCLLAYNRWFG